MSENNKNSFGVISDPSLSKDKDGKIQLSIEKFGKITIDFSGTPIEGYNKSRVFHSNPNYEGFMVRAPEGVDDELVKNIVEKMIYKMAIIALGDYLKCNE